MLDANEMTIRCHHQHIGALSSTMTTRINQRVLGCRSRDAFNVVAIADKVWMVRKTSVSHGDADVASSPATAMAARAVEHPQHLHGA